MRKPRKGSLVWSFKHRPPLSVTMISAILLLLMSSKEQLIDSLPLSNREMVELMGAWYMSLLKIAGVIFSILCIVLGVRKDDRPDTDKPF